MSISPKNSIPSYEEEGFEKESEHSVQHHESKPNITQEHVPSSGYTPIPPNPEISPIPSNHASPRAHPRSPTGGDPTAEEEQEYPDSFEQEGEQEH